MTTNQELWIFGAGDLARLAKFFFERDLDRAVAGFVVDEQYVGGAVSGLLPLLSWGEYLDTVASDETCVFPAIGYRSMRSRETIFRKILDAQQKICNLVCSTATISSCVQLGVGTFVMPGVVIEPGVVIGDNNVIWSNSTICHDSVIGSHNFVAANTVIGGRVKLGSRCFFGFSSVVGQRVSVCNDVLVGANSFLKNSVSKPGFYLGSPAIIRRSVDLPLGVCVSADIDA
jgi:sugar O-acyltransferase (sialic acid O-acetyltransferase NeuD family)